MNCRRMLIHRGGSCTVAMVLMALGVCAARAEDLPAALLAAAKAMPVAPGGRQTCLGILGLTNDARVSTVSATDAAEADPYSLRSTGAWLGDAPEGEPPSPFLQALLDAGVARRVPLVWNGAANGQTVERHGTAYLVSGAASAWFRHDREGWPAQPPLMVDTSPGPDIASRRTATPAGVWSTSHICYPLVKDRVLEYAEPEGPAGGRRIVTAAVLFHPAAPLPWLQDPRVATALDLRTGYLEPDEVRLVPFQDDGDGWRVAPYLLQRLDRVPTHIADPE